MKFIAFILYLCISLPGFSQEFECGDELVDTRDSRVYPTVKIGKQCWMAANLDYGVMVEDHNQKDNAVVEKTCWGNDPENCRIYGGLYTWNEMMDWKPGEGEQGICPDGWHVPTLAEWTTLAAFLGEDSAGYHMKVEKDHEPSWDGDNASGFTALPGGGGYESYFHRKDSWALFWSSTENEKDRAWFAYLDNYWYPVPPKYHNLYIGDYYRKFNGLSVRCIKNEQ